MKNKNPLYVVKGKEVQEASNIFDLVIKKFNLEPMVNILKMIFDYLLAQAQSYAWFVAIKTMVDELMSRMQDLGKKVGLLT